jgi:hypothetical protein
MGGADAMNTSIRAISLTLRELVSNHLKNDLNLRAFFDPAHGGTMVVSLLAPEELSATNEGVSLWLYRIVRDEDTLNYPPQRSARDRLLREPLPLRLHYLVVPVVDVTQRSDGPELEQNIVGAVMQELYDHATLRGVDFQGDLAGSTDEMYVRLESLDLDQMSRMWEALEHSFQLCISYEVSVVPIDSSLQPRVAPPVDAVMPTYAVITSEKQT